MQFARLYICEFNINESHDLLYTNNFDAVTRIHQSMVLTSDFSIRTYFSVQNLYKIDQKFIVVIIIIIIAIAVILFTILFFFFSSFFT